MGCARFLVFSLSVFFASLLFSSNCWAQITFITDPASLAANDSVDWSTNYGTIYPVTRGGLQIILHNSDNSTMVDFIYTQPGAGFFGNFLPGTTVFFVTDFNAALGNPHTVFFSFGSPVSGFGTHFSGVNFSLPPGDSMPFTARIQAFAGGTLLGTFSTTGLYNFNADGSVPFLGVSSSTANITSVSLSIIGPWNLTFYPDSVAFDSLLIRTGAQSALSAPTNLHATQVGFNGTQIQLTWDYGSDPIDGFEIESQIPSSGTGNWPPLTTVSFASACIPSTTTASSFTCTYGDTNVPPFFTTSYRISAYKGSTTNSSQFSNIATAYQLRKCPWSTGCKNFTDTGSDIQADFTPDPSLDSVQAAARALPPDASARFDHFNWLSYVEHYPQCYVSLPDYEKLHTWVSAPVLNIPVQGPTLPAPHFDPPPGGWYEYGQYPTYNPPPICYDAKNNPYKCRGPSDRLPFYWNEEKQWYLNNNYPLNPDFDITGIQRGW